MHLCKAEPILIAPFKELKLKPLHSKAVLCLVLIAPFKELKLGIHATFYRFRLILITPFKELKPTRR